MRVLLVTSEGACGISEHSNYLKAAVEAADPSIEVQLDSGSLDPEYAKGVITPDVLHLNYHSALHSRWTADALRYWRNWRGCPIAVTWHDSGVPNSDHCKSIHAVADAFVVHEPADDLPGAHYWRQGVPDWPSIETQPLERNRSRQLPHRPYVGSMGFPFPWKGFDLLAEASAKAGWGLLLLAPTATEEQCDRWKTLNPHAQIFVGFSHAVMVVSSLAQCDATAFLYNNCNTGTSGAIRQGIAARKPVLASGFPMGRQFIDLQSDQLGKQAITWLQDLSVDGVVKVLSEVRIAPIDAGMVALAEQDSWTKLGAKYAGLYRSLL